MAKKTTFAWGIANLAITIAAVAAGYFVVVYHQDIQDWWSLRNYTPPAAVTQLADNTTMQGFGRDIFYVSQPVVEDGQAFNEHCAAHRDEKTIVLGCYTNQRIYLYNVTDARLEGVKEVTAAHEMLHAAYQRMDDTEKSRLAALIEAQVATMADERLKSLIELYAREEPGERINELHSILGTEYTGLSAELETHYAQFFADRARVVEYAQKYGAAFTASQNHISQLARQLDSLKQQIDTNTEELNRQHARLNDRSNQLSQLRASDPAAYNAQVPSYNVQVNSYNSLVVATRQLIDRYNALVIEHNNEAAAQTDLYRSLDSRYQTVSQ